MEITINNQQKRIDLNDAHIKKLIKLILKSENVFDAILNFVFISSQKMRAMNIQYKNRYETTDVLAFDFSDECMISAKKGRPEKLFGDIYISTHAAVQNSHLYKTPLAQELILYVIHGILHLRGYDDHSPKDVKHMREKERELLEFLGSNINKSVIQR